MKLLILFGVIVLLALANGQKPSYSNICDVCNCIKPYGEQTKYVDCDCNAKPGVQNLNTTMQNMKGLDHIVKFSVTNCESLTFHKDSFKDCHDLTGVVVTHVRHVAYPVGVFAMLSTLTIDNVENLYFAPWAFTGSSLTVINIKHSNIGVLPKRSFSLENLVKFELSNVTINLIENQAINIRNQLNSVVIDGCEFKEMAGNAVVIKTNTFQLQNSKLYNISECAFNISASRIDVRDSVFPDYQEELSIFAGDAKIMNYENNSYGIFPVVKFTGHTKDSIIEFIDNKVLSFPSEFNATLRNVYFSGNSFKCDCPLVKQMRENAHLKDLQDANYCFSSCKIAINIRAVAKDLRICEDMDGEVEEFLDNICSQIMQVTTSTVKTSLEKTTVTLRPELNKLTKPMNTSTERPRMSKHLNTTSKLLPQSEKVSSSSIKFNFDIMKIGMIILLVIFNQA